MTSLGSEKSQDKAIFLKKKSDRASVTELKWGTF